MARDRRLWRYVVGDPDQVGGLLSGATAVYEYYGRRTRSGFAPGGINDYSVFPFPVVPSQAGPLPGIGAVNAARAVLRAVPSPTPARPNPVRESAGRPTPPGDDGPAPDPESIYASESRAPTDWEQVARDVAILNPEFEEDTPPAFIPVDAGAGQPDIYEPTTEAESMTTSFWDIASGVVDVIQGQPVGNPYGFAGPMTPAPGTGPATQYRRTASGQLVPCGRRRRRRRLLTESDFNDLMRISTLPNKENVRISLAKAIGRR